MTGQEWKEKLRNTTTEEKAKLILSSLVNYPNPEDSATSKTALAIDTQTLVTIIEQIEILLINHLEGTK